MENKGEKGMLLENNDASIGAAKGTSPDEVTLNSEEIKPIALVVIELRLSEGTSQSVSQIKKIEFLINLIKS